MYFEDSKIVVISKAIDTGITLLIDQVAIVIYET